MERLVCAILVNYNGREDTEACVESLLTAQYKNIRVVIVDNASTRNKVVYNQVIKKEQCNIIYMDENIGFAGANNIGIEYAKKYNPDFYLIINNDTVVQRNFLDPLINACDEDCHIGIATGKIYYYDEKNILWFGGSYYDEKLCECKIDGIGKKEEERHNIKKKIPFATGCLWLLPTNTIEKVGLMSEEYFLYYEDADYCERVKCVGLDIIYIPESIIYHKESRSTKKGSDSYHYYNIRNYLLFLKKYAKGYKRILAYLRKWYQTSKDAIRRRLKLRIYIMAWKDFVLNKIGNRKISLRRNR